MEKKHLSIKGQKLLSGMSIAVFILFWIATFIFIGRPMIEYVSNPEAFRKLVEEYSVMGKLIFIGMMTLQVVVAIIPGEPLELGAGYAFGAVWGTVLCLMGIALGTIIVYLFVKSCGSRAVKVFFSEEKLKSVSFLNNKKRMYLLAAVVYCIPGTPKDIITYFWGLTEMKPVPLVLIATIARIPSVVTSTLGGSALGEKRYLTAIIVFIVTLVISAVGLLIYKKIKEKHSNS